MSSSHYADAYMAHVNDEIFRLTFTMAFEKPIDDESRVQIIMPRNLFFQMLEGFLDIREQLKNGVEAEVLDEEQSPINTEQPGDPLDIIPKVMLAPGGFEEGAGVPEPKPTPEA